MATVSELQLGDIVVAGKVDYVTEGEAQGLPNMRGEVIATKDSGATIVWSDGRREFYSRHDTWVVFDLVNDAEAI